MSAATLGSVQLRVIQVWGEPAERRHRGWSRRDGGNPSDPKSLRRSPNSDSPPVTVVRVHELSARSPQLWGDRCAVGVAEKSETRTIRLPSLHSHSGASSKEGDREEREREGGRRGLMLLLGKNDAAAVLGGCRQTEGGGARGCGRRGEEAGGVADLLNPR